MGFFIDLGDDRFSITLFNKRDDLPFPTVKLPYFSRNIPCNVKSTNPSKMLAWECANK